MCTAKTGLIKWVVFTESVNMSGCWCQHSQQIRENQSFELPLDFQWVWELIKTSSHSFPAIDAFYSCSNCVFCFRAPWYGDILNHRFITALKHFGDVAFSSAISETKTSAVGLVWPSNQARVLCMFELRKFSNRTINQSLSGCDLSTFNLINASTHSD